MSQNPSCPSSDRLRALLDGGTSAEEQAKLTEHLDGCPRCQPSNTTVMR